MSASIGRQDGRRCALVRCGLLVMTAFIGRQSLAGDEINAIDGFILPHISHSHFADVLSTAQKRDEKSTQQADATSTARGRVTMDDRVKVVKKPSSAKATRKAAIAALPLAKMTDDNRRRVLQIVNGTSMFRELPTLRFQVDPRVYYFFMNHPDVAVSIWRVMQISEFQMHQTGPNAYETDDNDGTSGVIDVAHRGSSEVVSLCNGVYKSPLLPNAIKANGVLHVTVAFERTADGKTYATHTARLFVSFPSQTIETIAAIMSPLSNAIIDQNFREVSLFLHMMSTAMQRQPGWVENVSSRLDGILEVRKTQLMEVTVQVFADANPNLRHMPRRPAHQGDPGEEISGNSSRPNRTASREEPVAPR